MFELEAELKAHIEWAEGRTSKPYRDTVGKLTIGVGRNLEDVGLRESEIDFLLAQDVRDVLASQLTDLRGPARSVDLGLTLLRAIRAHPLVSAATAAAVLLYRPRRTLRWLGRAVTAYSFVRKMHGAFSER